MSDLPPREPPDLRRNRGDDFPNNPYDSGGQGQNQYPPRPQRPSGQQYPPAGGGQQQPPAGPSYPPQGSSRPQGGLPPQSPPRLGNERYEPAPRREFEDAPSKRLGEDQDGFNFDESMRERRIEYLAWGTVVLGAGLCIIILAIDFEATNRIVFVMAPLLGGLILLASGFLQRVVFGYHVSVLTWGTAILGVAFGTTSFIGRVVADTTILTQGLIFIGLLIVLAGLVIIGQVFSRPPR
ncbi:MAG: hypothetical protein ACLFTK_04930 [Anaerolineales bacterium]